jgi:hypothetical protein
MMAPTGMVCRTGFNGGKVKFSRVLSIQKHSEIGTASGVTSHMVPPDGSSRGIRFLSRSWRGYRAMAKEAKDCGECANNALGDEHLRRSELPVPARGELDEVGGLRPSGLLRDCVGAGGWLLLSGAD